MFTDLKNFKSALLSTFMITCIKSAILKMYIDAGSVSSSLKSKHRIFFCTLILNVSKYTCFLYNIVPRDTRLGRLYKMSAECTTEKKSLHTEGTSTHMVAIIQEEGMGYVVFHDLLWTPLFVHFTGKLQNNFSWSLISAILLRF